MTSWLSHPPLRAIPPVGQRPLAAGPAYFVDPARGDDANPGDERAPWRTVNRAMLRLRAGDTLYLRAGVYFENVRCSVIGTPDAPIAIRAYPGERAIIDGGLAEFQLAPAEAWEPCADGAPGEYRSRRAYPNLRDMLGMFGDSFCGLQSYWHVEDLRADNELDVRDEQGGIAPMYCGPGLWYDRATGAIHVRLAHTHIDNPRVSNYRGETDPRRLPLILSPFRSVPLFVDAAKHVRFQDLVFRGGGEDVVSLDFSVNIDFENVILLGGANGLRGRSTGPLKFLHSAIYGIFPPWAFRTEQCRMTDSFRDPSPYGRDAVFDDSFIPEAEAPEDHAEAERRLWANGLDSYYDTMDARPRFRRRNIARLPSHTLVICEGSLEAELDGYNHDWEVAWSEFTNSHDGVFFCGRHMRFHHNWLHAIQDDSIYLTSVTPLASHKVYIYQNLIAGSAIGFGMHNRGGPRGDIYVFRNVIDLRMPAHNERPTPDEPHGVLNNFGVVCGHGLGLMSAESIHYYHNTCIGGTYSSPYAHSMLIWCHPDTRRDCLNNLFVYRPGWPQRGPNSRQGEYQYTDADVPDLDVHLDGNLHWSPEHEGESDAFRALQAEVAACAASQRNVARHGAWDEHSLVADPAFATWRDDPDAVNDYRLRADSPARGAGSILPEGLYDPLRPADNAAPDIGALPHHAKPLRTGIGGRRVAGEPGDAVPSE